MANNGNSVFYETHGLLKVIDMVDKKINAKMYVFVVALICSMMVMFIYVDISLSAERLVMISSNQVVKINNAVPGDVFYVPDGVYQDVEIRFESSGNSGNPVFLKAKTPGKVIFKGVSSIKILSDYTEVSGFKFENVTGVNSVVFIGAKHSRLTDCAFMDCSAPRYSTPRIICLKEGAQFSRVDHCFMQGNTSIGMGVWIQEGDKISTDNRFDHNYFKDFVKVRDNVQEAIQIGQLNFNLGYYANTVVEYNLFENASGEGEHGEIISNKSSGNVYRYNTFRDCLGSLSLRTGEKCTVEGNWFFNVGEGVKVFGNDHEIINNYFEDGKFGVWLPSGTGRGRGAGVGPYEVTDDTVVAGNSFYNCETHAIYLGQGLGTKVSYEGKSFTRSYQPTNCKIYNNAMLGKSVFLLSLYKGVSAANFDFKANVLSPADGSKTGYVGEGVSLAVVNFEKNGECYRVKSSSQKFLVDKGIDMESLQYDIDGQRRTGHPDIGDDEFVDETVEYVPLTANDVGPSWMLTTTKLLPVKNLKIAE